jgi:hypothetical protein
MTDDDKLPYDETQVIMDAAVSIAKVLDDLTHLQRHRTLRWLTDRYGKPSVPNIFEGQPFPTHPSDIRIVGDLIKVTRPVNYWHQLLVGFYFHRVFLKQKTSRVGRVHRDIKPFIRGEIPNISRTMMQLRKKNPVLIEALRPESDAESVQQTQFDYYITEAGMHEVENMMPGDFHVSLKKWQSLQYEVAPV